MRAGDISAVRIHVVTGSSSALFICVAASSQLTDAEVTASVYRFPLETCCTGQRNCYLAEVLLLSGSCVVTRAVCSVLQTGNGCRSLGAVLETGASV